MRNEVKIGLLALVAIALSVWGFRYIQGSNLFSSSNTFYVNYTDVAGLTVGTPVQISGVNIGSVSAIQLDQTSKQVRVELTVRDEINVPADTKAYITTVSLLGEKAVTLEYERPCFGDGGCAEDGATLEGSAKGILASFLGTDPDADPTDGLKDQVGGIVDSLEWTLFSEESDNPIARSSRDLAVTMENLKRSTAQLQRIIDNNAAEINQTMDNLATLSNSLASKEENIAGIIDNTEQLTGELSELELEQTVQEVNNSMRRIQGTLDEADRALGGVTNLVSDVQSGKGTLGKLLTDDQIYTRLNRASLAADTLLTDINARPYRYIPFKSRRRVLKFDERDEELREEIREELLEETRKR